MFSEIGDTTSWTEKSFMHGGCALDIREDGRRQFDVRTLAIELDVLPQCNGSCRLSIGTTTDILCSVKLEVAEPTQSSPSDGVLEVFVDLSPSMNLRVDKRRLQEEASVIGAQLKDILVSSKALDLAKLCIIPGRLCWLVHIDIMYFQLDASAVDSGSYASYAALKSASCPYVELINGESGFPEDFELSSDLSLASKLPISDLGMPISISVAEIGGSLILDCCSAELDCASSIISCSFDINGVCCGIRKGKKQPLSLDLMEKAFLLAGSLATSILAHLDSSLTSSEHHREKQLLHPEVVRTSLGQLV